MSLLVVGSMAFDAIETPFHKSDRIVGGAATYIALAASNFSTPVNVISVIGNDFPREELEDLQSRHISLDGVEVRKDEKSFFWSGKYHLDMNARDTLVTELNVLADFRPVVPRPWRGSDFLILGNLDPRVQTSVLNQLDHRPKLVALDTMNFWMDTAMEELKKVLQRVDVLLINDSEARQLTGEYSLVKAASAIFKMGPAFVVIKKGEHGALLFHQKKVFYAPALPLEDVYDPTGAGDTFAGGFMGHIARTGDVSFNNMKTGIIVGSAMASFCVEKFGTERLRDLTQGDIEKRIGRFIDLVHFDIALG